MLPIRVKTTSVAAEEVAYNEDLLAEILLRLPTNSVIRFKSVSKHWLAFISSPNFSCRYVTTNSHILAPSGLFLRVSSTKEDFGFLSFSNPQLASPPMTTNPLGLNISQSCNGLLCCYTLSSPNYVFKYYIYNPTTNQFFTLPTSDLSSTLPSGGLGLESHIYLAFDPRKSPYYQVVCIWGWNIAATKFHQIEIYSSETSQWRTSGAQFQANKFNQFDTGGIYANGSIHWIYDEIYFNIKEEKIERMPMSPWPAEGSMYRAKNVYESRDYLHLVDYYLVEFKCDVYELARDYSKWFVKHRFDISHLLSPMARSDLSYSYPDLIFISRGEMEEDTFLVLRIGEDFVQYNVTNKNFKKLCSIPNHGFVKQGMFISAYPFVESLCSV